jgi:hypothetical protein
MRLLHSSSNDLLLLYETRSFFLESSGSSFY